MGSLLHLAGWRQLLLSALLWAAAPGATADTALQLPLTIPYELLGDLVWQPGEGDGPVEFDDGPCRRLRIDSSRLEPRDGALHLVSSVEAALGVSLLGRCIEPINWRGTVDMLLEPYLDAAWQLRFRLGATELRDPQGDPAPLLNFVWDLSQRFINRRVEAFGFDLQAPREQVTELLSALLEPEGLVDLQAVLASVRLGAPRADARGVQIEAQLSLPDSLTERLLPPRPAAAPAAADLARIQLERLDAFVVAAVKLLSGEIADPALRQQLAALLLDSRYRLVEILSAAGPFAQDPVRALFIEDWERLRAVVLAGGVGAGGQSRLLRYAAFVNAGDLLLALDAALPQLGLWVSADGLRAALRELAPAAPEPSLEYGYGVDPGLRELFGLPPEPPPLPPDADLLEPVDGDGELPSYPDGLDDDPDAFDNSALRLPIWARLLEGLIPSARAATAVPDRITELQRAIGRRIPRREQLPAYAAQVAELLEEIGRSELAARSLPEGHAAVYRHLLPAAALIESCWRQFKREDGKLTYLVSSAGAVGMMQINQRVWRGLYDVERLKWEVAYNARAGAQILLRYLEGPGRDVVKRTGNPEHLARATYAAYNAGP
ncbi:MAG: hypothetical protein RLZ44_836, partial [Pseudomonadota bacterium]